MLLYNYKDIVTNPTHTSRSLLDYFSVSQLVL